jgi:hypothetical protein
MPYGAASPTSLAAKYTSTKSSAANPVSFHRPKVASKKTITTVLCVFVDGSLDYRHLYLQSSTYGEQTLAVKRGDFKRKAKTCGQVIIAYHGDNGSFVEHKFQQDLKEQCQSLSVCGVGAHHHQSGIAERQTRTLSKRPRVILLHSYVRWPKTISH